MCTFYISTYANFFFVFSASAAASSTLTVVTTTCGSAAAVVIIAILVVLLVRIRATKQDMAIDMEPEDFEQKGDNTKCTLSMVLSIMDAEEDPFTNDFKEDKFLNQM